MKIGYARVSTEDQNLARVGRLTAVARVAQINWSRAGLKRSVSRRMRLDEMVGESCRRASTRFLTPRAGPEAVSGSGRSGVGWLSGAIGSDAVADKVPPLRRA